MSRRYVFLGGGWCLVISEENGCSRFVLIYPKSWVRQCVALYLLDIFSE